MKKIIAKLSIFALVIASVGYVNSTSILAEEFTEPVVIETNEGFIDLTKGYEISLGPYTHD